MVGTSPETGGRLQVLHLINTFRVGGGAQEMLRKLIASSHSQFDQTVVTLRDNERDDIPMDVPSKSLSLRGLTDLPRAAAAFRRILKRRPPDVIVSWMYHSCVFAQMLAPKSTPVIWNIRHSLNRLDSEKLGTRLAISACARLSSRAHQIIYCSQNAIPSHQSVGFQNQNAVFIPNGFNLDVFRPYEPVERHRIRMAFGIPCDAFVFGQAVRFHPMKNQAGLIRAFGALARRDPGVHLVLAGRGVTEENPKLASLLESEGVQGRTTLLGLQDRMSDVFNCFDVYVSSSLWGEGFPNVVGEAMSCGVPCIVTDVGDSAEVVGSCGLVVDGANVMSISNAMMYFRDLAPADLNSLRNESRSRVRERFSIDVVKKMYAQTLCAAR
jgi:glycosyltransferase involved in cell wall biosynthesis